MKRVTMVFEVDTEAETSNQGFAKAAVEHLLNMENKDLQRHGIAEVSVLISFKMARVLSATEEA